MYNCIFNAVEYLCQIFFSEKVKYGKLIGETFLKHLTLNRDVHSFLCWLFIILSVLLKKQKRKTFLPFHREMTLIFCLHVPSSGVIIAAMKRLKLPSSLIDHYFFHELNLSPICLWETVALVEYTLTPQMWRVWTAGVCWNTWRFGAMLLWCVQNTVFHFIFETSIDKDTWTWTLHM